MSKFTIVKYTGNYPWVSGTDDVRVNFGKYKGACITSIIERGNSYTSWLLMTVVMSDKVRSIIEQHLESYRDFQGGFDDDNGDFADEWHPGHPSNYGSN